MLTHVIVTIPKQRRFSYFHGRAASCWTDGDCWAGNLFNGKDIWRKCQRIYGQFAIRHRLPFNISLRDKKKNAVLQTSYVHRQSVETCYVTSWTRLGRSKSNQKYKQNQFWFCLKLSVASSECIRSFTLSSSTTRTLVGCWSDAVYPGALGTHLLGLHSMQPPFSFLLNCLHQVCTRLICHPCIGYPGNTDANQ